MNINQRFAVFCAQKCLPLWQAPQKVVEWLENPKQETAGAASDAASWSVYIAVDAAYAVRAKRFAAEAAAHAAAYIAADAADAAAYIAVDAAAFFTADAMNTSVDELRQEFVRTWSEEELSTEDPDWIEYATAEIMNREH